MINLIKAAKLKFIILTLLSFSAMSVDSLLCPHKIDFSDNFFQGIEAPILHKVVDREEGNPNSKLKMRERFLEDLLSQDSFEGKYFKIVKGQGNDAITINDDEELRLKAATVYFHLTKARKYYVDNLGMEDIHKKYGQLIIRLDIRNSFHQLFHYVHEDVNKVSNNATTVVCGQNLEIPGVFGEPQKVDSWGPEIWFRPGVKTKIPNHKEELKQNTKELLSGNGVILSEDLLITEGIFGLKNDDFNGAWDNIQSTGIEFLAYYGISLFMTEFFALVLPGSFRLETALVPEVIYHEYSHLFLGDYLPPNINNPLIEGLSDFFAAQIADNHELARKLGKFGKAIRYRDAKSVTPYKLEYDSKVTLGNNDFVLSFLWDVKEMLVEKGEKESEVVFKIFEMRKLLDRQATIRDSLPRAIVRTFPKYRRKLLTLMLKRGL